VHGALGDYRQWSALAGPLRSRFRVVAISRRYHWPNPPPGADDVYTYERHCDDLLAAVKAGGRRVHLVGHSYGAGVVLLAALREPDRIETLTLVEPPFASLLPAAAPGLEEEISSRAAMVERVQALARQGHEREAGQLLIEWTQGGPPAFSMLPAAVRRGFEDNARTAGPTYGSIPPSITREDSSRLRVRTLIMTGEHTRLYFRLIAASAAASIPGAAATRVGSARHMVIVERPVETAERILEFLLND